jgi:hypothetical protein
MSGDDDDLFDLLGPEPEPKNRGVHTSPAARKHAGGRQTFLESRSYPTHRAVGKLNSPERLKRILKYCAELPVNNSVCMRAGISTTTLKYWLQKSSNGAPGDGFDVATELGPDEGPATIRFHEAWDISVEAGTDRVESAVMRKAIGYREVLTFQGRVQYVMDPEKLALGLLGADAYKIDDFGSPIPETVEKQDPDLAMFVLKNRRANIYGDKKQIDVNIKGGVLVVGVKASSPEALNDMEEEYRRQGRPAVTFEDDGEDNT